MTNIIFVYKMPFNNFTKIYTEIQNLTYREHITWSESSAARSGMSEPRGEVIRLTEPSSSKTYTV